MSSLVEPNEQLNLVDCLIVQGGNYFFTHGLLELRKKKSSKTAFCVLFKELKKISVTNIQKKIYKGTNTFSWHCIKL